MRAAPDPPAPASAAPHPGPVPHEPGEGETLAPLRTPPDCLASAFSPGSRGLETQALAPENRPRGRHPVPPFQVSVRPAVWHRLGHPVECQGSPEHHFLKSQASSGCVAVCVFDSPPPSFHPMPAPAPGR